MSEHAPYGPPNPHAPYEVGGAGTVNRAQLATVLSEGILLNVKEYGALGTGQVGNAAAEGVQLQNALNAAKENGLFFPAAAAGYMTNKKLKVLSGTTLAGESEWRSIIRTTSTTEYVLELVEGAINIGNLRFEAQTKQTAGGAIDYSQTTSFVRLENCTLGDRFFIGLNIAPNSLVAPAGGGAYPIDTVKWSEAGAGMKETGTCIRIGDGSHLVVGVWATKVYILGNTTAGITQAIVLNYCDSCTLTDSLIQTVGKGIVTGTVGPKETTGLKILDTVVDTVAGPCFDLALCLDVVITGCNAQGGTQGVALRTEKEGGPAAAGVRIIGCKLQRNAGQGFIAEIKCNNWKLIGNSIISNATAGGAPGVHVIQGNHHFTIVGNDVFNDPDLPGGKQTKGIFVESGEAAGKTDNYVIEGNVCTTDAEQLIGVEDVGTNGKNKRVRGNVEGPVEYRAKTARATGAQIAGSTASDVFMALAVTTQAATATTVELQVDGKWAGEATAPAAAATATVLPMFAVVPSGKSWELKVLAGVVTGAASSYLPL